MEIDRPPPSQPSARSEAGLGEGGPPGEDFAYKHVTSPDELVREYERLVTSIDPSVAGFVWTQLTDVEGELNGLHMRDRRPKAPPEAVRRINQSF